MVVERNGKIEKERGDESLVFMPFLKKERDLSVILLCLLC